MTPILHYGYLLRFRLAGYGWHQRSEFNASFTTYRFFSGFQVLHAICRFESLINLIGAAYRPEQRLRELEAHALPALGVPPGRRWASPAVPVDTSTNRQGTIDRQVYNSRPEPVVGWDRAAVFPTWGTLEMMRPFPPDEPQAYPFQALYLAENEHDIRVGDTYCIGKKRASIQVTDVMAAAVELTEVENRETGLFLEVPLEQLAMFESYRVHDATGRGQVIVAGTFSGRAVVCENVAVPIGVLGEDA